MAASVEMTPLSQEYDDAISHRPGQDVVAAVAAASGDDDDVEYEPVEDIMAMRQPAPDTDLHDYLVPRQRRPSPSSPQRPSPRLPSRGQDNTTKRGVVAAIVALLVLVLAVAGGMGWQIQNVNSKVEQQQAVIAQLQQDNIQLQQKLTSCSQQIAFDARSSSRDITVTGGQNVVYVKTMLNYGNGYNNSTGVFTCVVPGIYVFTVHALSNTVSSDYAYLYLKHNSEYVAGLYAGRDDTHESASMSAVVHMEAGDVVKVVAGDTSKLYSKLDNKFHGHLVQADGCQP